jgi:hypothetical protein
VAISQCAKGKSRLGPKESKKERVLCERMTVDAETIQSKQWVRVFDGNTYRRGKVLDIAGMEILIYERSNLDEHCFKTLELSRGSIDGACFLRICSRVGTAEPDLGCFSCANPHKAVYL